MVLFAVLCLSRDFRLPAQARPLIHPKAAAPTRIFFIAQSSRF